MKYTEKEITAYFNKLDRSKFMDQHKEAAEFDRPSPIGHGQTISQPSLVLNMTLQLELEEGNKVLEIGTGSGFQTALLAGFAESVYTVERIEALYTKAKERLQDEGYSNIHFHYGDGSLGWEAHAPYDRIMVTAAAEKLPPALVEQLAPGGKIIIPIGNFFDQALKLIEKDEDGKVHTSFLEHVVFVKLEEDKE